MKRRLCLPKPSRIPYYTHCDMQFERRCADASGAIIENICKGEIWTPASPQVANKIARELIVGCARAKTLECQCYDPVGDLDPGTTYYRQTNCQPEPSSSDCDTLCFYTDLEESDFVNGVFISTGVPFTLIILDTFCSINGSTFCNFADNLYEVTLTARRTDSLLVPIFSSLDSYCPYFQQEITLLAGEYELYFTFIFNSGPDQVVYINSDNDVFSWAGTMIIGGVEYNQACYTESLEGSCKFCTTFSGYSEANNYLVAEVGEASGGNYLALFDPNTTLRFAFKPYECRDGDPTISPMPTRYCGANFYLKVLPLDDYSVNDYSNAVDIFDSAEIPEVCNCEVFSFTLEDAGNYVIIFDDLNTGFKCLANIAYIVAQSNDPSYASIAEQCLGKVFNYYLTCFDLAQEVCTEEPTFLWRTTFVGLDNSEASFECESECLVTQRLNRPWSITAVIFPGCTLGPSEIIPGGAPLYRRLRRWANSVPGAGNPPAITADYPDTFYDEFGEAFFESHGEQVITDWLPDTVDLQAARNAVAEIVSPDYEDTFYTVFVVEQYQAECVDTETYARTIVSFQSLFNGLKGQTLGQRAVFLANHPALTFTIFDGAAVEQNTVIFGAATPATLNDTNIGIVLAWMAANIYDFDQTWTVDADSGTFIIRGICNEETPAYKVTGFATNIPQEI